MVYFSTTFESAWLKLVLKLMSTLIIIQVAYIPLTDVSLADRAGLYDLFAWLIANGMYLFWAIWFVVLFKETLEFLADRKKERIEGIDK